MQRKTYYTYILTNKRNTVLYVGVTNDIVRRVNEHKAGVVTGFTKRYRVTKLVFVEEFGDVKQAIRREKQLKNWHREWKENLIRQSNPDFLDLTAEGSTGESLLWTYTIDVLPNGSGAARSGPMASALALSATATDRLEPENA